MNRFMLGRAGFNATTNVVRLFSLIAESKALFRELLCILAICTLIEVIVEASLDQMSS